MSKASEWARDAKAIGLLRPKLTTATMEVTALESGGVAIEGACQYPKCLWLTADEVNALRRWLAEFFTEPGEVAP